MVMDNSEETKLEVPKRRAKHVTGIDAGELPDLDERELKFFELMLKDDNATKAYREAFNSQAKDSSIWCEASKLRNSPKMRQWFAAAKIARLGSSALTLDAHILNLDRLQELAIQNGNVSAAVQAEQIKGKASGLHVDRVMDVTPEPIDYLMEIAKRSPEYAKQLAAEAGIELPEITAH